MMMIELYLNKTYGSSLLSVFNIIFLGFFKFRVTFLFRLDQLGVRIYGFSITFPVMMMLVMVVVMLLMVVLPVMMMMLFPRRRGWRLLPVDLVVMPFAVVVVHKPLQISTKRSVRNLDYCTGTFCIAKWWKHLTYGDDGHCG